MENLPTKTNGAAAAPIINYDDSAMLRTIKTTVAKGATDEEFHMFVQLAKSTGLNPFKREIWFIKTKSQAQIMTGINGFYSIANNHPQYDGIEVDTEFKDGKPFCSVASVYRKDRSRPSVAKAYWSEYGKSHGNWQTMPRVMLEKCAESMALRKAFPQELNGLYTSEEMPAKFDKENAVTVERKAEPAVVDVPPEPLENPGFHKLEAPKSINKGKRLVEIHQEDGGFDWLMQAVEDKRRRKALTPADIVNIEAYLMSDDRFVSLDDDDMPA